MLFNVVNKILKLGMIFLNLFFRFLYFEEVEINENLVIGIIYVVEKYGIIDLLWKCEFFFENNLIEDNICIILENVLCYNMDGLF